MYESSFRLRGKTYDYKIQYDAIKKFMVLPKPDDMHCMLCVGLDPPLRQGQTRYPFVVMQFKKDEEVTIDLNLEEEELQSKYKDKLEPHYEEPLHHVVAKIFRGLANKKISSPAKDFITYVSMNFTFVEFLLMRCTDTAASTESSVLSRPAKVSCTA
jgi:structure-specific recognition protein 1